MSRIATGVFLFAGLVTVSCGGGKAEEAARPNILMIIVDDLRPELGCYGAEQIRSPNIDRLAARGTLFTRSYCNIPVCGASRASLLTGIRPARERFLRYDTWADKDAPGVPTLPGYFRQNGYYTVSNSKVFHHDRDAAGSWDEIWHPASASRSWRDYVTPENQRMDRDNPGGPPMERAAVEDSAYKDGKTTAKTLADLGRLKKLDKPFFMAVGFLKPHLPFNAPERYWKLYDEEITLPDNNMPPENAPRESLHNWGELRAYAGIPETGPLTDSAARELIRGYYACISYTDAQVGRVLDELERLELDRSTIVVLFGDHGWNLREHGLWCKHCNYETSLHTPLILYVPGKEQVASSEQIVEYVDLYPTLCELADLEVPEHTDGVSFRELLYDPAATTDGVAVCQWYEGITTIRWPYFYTEWVDERDVPYARMLYDHTIDPDENRNIAGDPDRIGTVEALSEELRISRAHPYFPAK